MYTIQIKPWGNDKAARHTSTLFEICSDKSFDKDKIVESKRVTIEDDGSLCMYTTNILVPTGEEYYVRATREFKSLPSANHTIEPFLLTPSILDEALFNNIVLNDPINIETPFIYINEEELRNDNKDYFTVTTSKFRCNQDGHIATHLVITNMEDEVLYANLNERVDKLEFRVFKTKDIKEASLFVIRATHVSTNMFESKQGKLVVQNLNFRFDIKGLTSEAPAYQDLPLYIVSNVMNSTVARDTLISKVYFRNAEDDPKTTRAVDVTPPMNTSTITIPGGLLKPNGSYYLEVYCYDNNGTGTTRRISITTERSSVTPTFDNTNFKLSIEDYNEDKDSSIYKNVDVPTEFTTYQLKDGTYIVPSVGDEKENVKAYKVLRTSTIDGGSSIIDLKNPVATRTDIKGTTDVTADGFYARMFNEAILLIDLPNGDSHPEFKKYIYNGATNTFEYQDSKVRENENSAQGYNCSLIQIDRDTLWYVTNVESYENRKVMSLNLDTLDIQEVADISSKGEPTDPYTVNGRCGMFYNRKRGFVGVILPNGKIVVIDPITKGIKELVESPMVNWSVGTDNTIKTIELSNGDYIFINTKEGALSNEEGNTDPTPIVYYDCELGKFTKIPFNFEHSYTLKGNFCSNSPESYLLLNRKDDSDKCKPLRIY